MKKYAIIAALCGVAAVFPVPAETLTAADTEPCIVASGRSEENVALPLALYNRVTFDADSFIISSSENDQLEPVVLPYSLFNRIAFMETTSTDSVEDMISETGPTLYYNGADQTVNLISHDGDACNLLILSPAGNLLISATIADGSPVSVAQLPSGVYIAVLVKDNESFALKFMK